MENNEPKKEYDKMTENYQNVQHTEFLMVHTLNLTMPYAWICAGLVFEIRPSHQYGKYDARLCWIEENREKKVIAKIELEFGKNQEDWDSDIPRDKWRRGISLLKRKDYDASQLFIKMSPTYNSIILVDTRDNFVQNNTISDKTPHNMGFITHEDCYVFPWETVDKNLFIIAGGSIYQDGNIFLVQKGISTLVEERKKMYEFIDHKFFSDSIRNLIKSYEQQE
jgi:hypothetical protein